MSLRVRTTVYIALIFLSGALIGATLMNLAEHDWLHAESRTEIDIRHHREIAREMSKRLNLSQAQQQQVNRILQQTIQAYLQVESSVAPRYAYIRAQGRAHMRSILNPDQRRQFDQIVRSVDERYPQLEPSPEIPVDSAMEKSCTQASKPLPPLP